MNEDTGEQPVDINTDDQPAFEAEFFNKEPAPKEEAPVEDDSLEDADEDAHEAENEDADEPEEDSEDEDEGEEEQEEDEKPQAKKNRKSAQERINELTADKHEERRLRLALEARLAELEKSVKPEKAEEKPLREMLAVDAPNPDAVGEDGAPLYPLGEFDPKFITALTRFTIEQETKAVREREAQESQARAIQAQQEAVRQEYTSRLEEYEKEVPEVRQNITELTETFANMDPAYGEFLATSIMSSEVGPQILDYLSQNIGEAQKIVASGPAAALLTLGRLEYQLKPSTEKETKRNTKRVSKAQEPPTERSRGTNAKFTVPDDTDDQPAFEREFFKKK